MVTVTTIINILQTLLAVPEGDPVLPWSLSSSTEAGYDIWTVHLKIPPGQDPLSTFTNWYWTLQAAVEHSPHLGLVVIEPRVVVITSIFGPGQVKTPKNFFFTFKIRIWEGIRPTIWNPVHPLEVENPITPRESIVKARIVIKHIKDHALFGFNADSVFRVLNIEVPLISKPTQFKLLVTRHHDPSCRLPLPRRLEDYDLAQNIRVVSYHMIENKYHASIVDLICGWVFTFTFKPNGP